MTSKNSKTTKSKTLTTNQIVIPTSDLLVSLPHSTGKSRGFPVFLYPPACFFSKRPHRFSHMELLDYTLAPEVRAFSTPRTALCPTFETDNSYAGFNLTDYCGDTPAHVAECREALCAELKITDSQLLLPHQTHTNRVALVDEALMEMERGERNRHLRDIDALVTALPHVCIGISTADCVPVLLYDPKHRVIGAAHAGWRGMVGHILAHTIERMRTLGTNPRDLHAVIGPCIGPDSFEVGEEVVDAFLQAKFPPAVVRRGFFRRPHIDLWAAAVHELEQSGVPLEAILVSGIDTYACPDRFFSARRLGIQSGRIYSGIVLS